MRRGGHERPPRLLLPAQPLLHRRERTREIADLVARAVLGQLDVEAALRHVERTRVQPAEAPQQRRRDREPKQERDRQPRQRRGGERVAHVAGGCGDVVEWLDERDHEAHVAVVHGHGDPRLAGAAAAALRERAAWAWRTHVGRLLPRLARPRVDERLPGRADDRHAGAGPALERMRETLELLVARPQRRQRQIGECRPRGHRRVEQGAHLLVPQPPLESRQDGDGRHRERHSRGEHEGGDEPRAQSDRQAREHRQALRR